MVTILKHHHTRETHHIADNFAGVGELRRDWGGLGVFRLHTEGGALWIAPQSRHWLSVQTCPQVILTELLTGQVRDVSPHAPGNVNVIGAHTATQWLFDVDTDDIFLEIDPVSLARFAPNAKPVGLILATGKNDPTIEGIAQLLNREIASGCPNGRLFGEGLATALGAHLLANHAVFPATFKEYQRGLSKANLKRVTDYINDNLANDVSLEALASIVAISPYHFCRLFKQITGLPPHRYVIRERAERAKALLLRGGLSVTKVAAAVGFADAAHLTRHMKRLLGITPGKVKSSS